VDEQGRLSKKEDGLWGSVNVEGTWADYDLHTRFPRSILLGQFIHFPCRDVADKIHPSGL
jgi:hypothetical protein